ncbi:hypothetical protein R3P38DRAFT_3171426 [Favolaschia claudopus]|uniref:Uncharacterized protein n=1 Tax=Favolaschia claudopus TaxID=2862362 RepID=A0AAW0DRJ4_9AGAR
MATPADAIRDPEPHQELVSTMRQMAALTKASIELAQRSIQVDEKGLSLLALDMAKHCVEINEKLPRVIAAEVATARWEEEAAAFGSLNVNDRDDRPTFVQGVAPTPDEMETTFQPGNGDNQNWYVVCVGRMPGLYPDPDSANAQVLGVPDQSRRKVSGRAAALAYYRQMYDDNKVMRLNEQDQGQ